MRLVPLTLAISGKTIVRNVVDGAGQVLLVAGSTLSDRYIERLMTRGVTAVYLADDALPVSQGGDALQFQADTQAEAISLARAAVRPGPAAALAERVMRATLVGLFENEAVAGALTALHGESPYTFRHALHVAALALSLGNSALGLAEEQLRLLAAGALLADIGTLRYASLVRLPRSLTPEEFSLMQRHAEEGHRQLLGPAGCDPVVAGVAYQHHERLDGSGYPRGLRASEIHPFARITAVADVYDALVAERPFRRGMPPHEAMGVLRGLSGEKLDAEHVRVLSEQLAVYAKGSPVLLSTGELAVVMDQGPRGAAWPLVRVIADRDLRPVAAHAVDLGADPEQRSIGRVLSDYPADLRRQLRGY